MYDLYGFNETAQFFARLLSNRFVGLEHLFPPDESDPEICDAAVKGKIPTCIHIHGYAKLDMAVIGSHFEALEPEVRDILFQVNMHALPQHVYIMPCMYMDSKAYNTMSISVTHYTL